MSSKFHGAALASDPSIPDFSTRWPPTRAFPRATKRKDEAKSWKRISVSKDRKSTRLNSSHANISYAVFCLQKKSTRVHSSDANISHAVLRSKSILQFR